MSDPKPRRVRQPAVPRKALDRIGEGIAERVQPPVPPGLGEGLLDRAGHDAVNHQLEGLIGRLLERCEMNGKQLDAVDAKIDRMERRLEGVAYRRDIEAFMARDDIERRIEKAADGAKSEAKEQVGTVRKEVEKLQGLVKWAGLGITTTLAGVLLKMILTAAHIPT